MTGEFTIPLSNGAELHCKLSNMAIYNLDREFGYSFFGRLMQDAMTGNIAGCLDSYKIVALVYYTQADKRKYTRDQLINALDFSKFDEIFEKIGNVVQENEIVQPVDVDADPGKKK